MVRTPYCDKSGMKKGTWTIEEDRKLIAYVTKYGCWNWRQLPKYAGTYIKQTYTTPVLHKLNLTKFPNYMIKYFSM